MKFWGMNFFWKWFRWRIHCGGVLCFRFFCVVIITLIPLLFWISSTRVNNDKALSHRLYNRQDKDDDVCAEGFVPDGLNCRPCPAGRYWTRSSSGGVECLDCPPGKYSVPAAIQSSECRACPLGFFSPDPASPLCKSCGPNTTTLTAGSESRKDCLCAAGFRLTGAEPDGSLICLACREYEWCLPGGFISYWTISQYCSPKNTNEFGIPSLCRGFPETSPALLVQDKCYKTDQCPTFYAVEKGETTCVDPYIGVKCRECHSGYGRSLVQGLMGPCESCIGHYIYFVFFIVGMSTVSLWVILLLKRRDALNMSRAVVIIRVFIQHLQIVSILRYLRIPWVGPFSSWLHFITMGVPLAEIIGCIVYTSPWTSPLIVSIQILSFFPLILVVWSCIIGFIAKQLRNWAKRQNESIQRPDVVAKKSSIEKSGIQRWLTFKDTKKEDENSEKRDLTYSKSMVPQVPTEGWKYFGVFTFMYFTCLVSMSMPLFWSIQCVHLDATGKAHLFAGLDTVCDEDDQRALRVWGLVSIVLWIWVVPMVYVIVMWLKAQTLTTAKFSDGWGYLLHGYRRDVQCWQCFAIIRLSILMTVAGAPSPWQPSPLVIPFGARSFYAYTPPPDSDTGSFDAVLGGFLMYLLGEFIRELYSVGVNSADTGLTCLVRISSLTNIITWAAAMIAKVDSTGTFGDLKMVEEEVDRSAPGSAKDLADFKVRRATTGWLHFLCAVAAILHIFFLLWTFVTLIEGFSAPRWLRVYCPKSVNFEARVRSFLNGIRDFGHTIRQHTEEAAVGTYESVAAAAMGSERLQQTRVAPINVVADRSHPSSGKTTLSELRRSQELGVARKDDIAAAIDAIESGSERAQTIAALLRLTLHPFVIVGNIATCLHLLTTEGFDRRALETSVRAFVDFRLGLLERLCLMKEDFLVDAWWTSRRLGLLRYPVLEDSSLQLIAPVTLSTVRRVSVGEDLDHADSLTLRITGVHNIERFCLMSYDLSNQRTAKRTNRTTQELRNSIADVMWFAGSTMLKGWVPRSRKGLGVSLETEEDLAKLYDVPHRITIGGVEDPFLQDLTQRVLQCLLLDLSDSRYHIPRDLPIDRFLATGVPPGTRNDGKTDSVIRNYQGELNRKNAQSRAERPEQSIRLGRLLRRRMMDARAKEDVSRREQQRVADAFQFAEIETPELRKKRDLESAIEVTSAFLSIFPDARPSVHFISGEKDRTKNPEKLVIVMQDKMLIPTTESQPQKDEAYVGFLTSALQYLQGELVGEIAPSPLALPKPPISKRKRTEEADIPYLLFALTCVGGQFSAEPPEVGIFVLGNLASVIGPDGTRIALDTTRPTSVSKESEDDLRQMTASSTGESVPLPSLLADRSPYVTLDPIVELAPSPLGTLVSGEADWTLEAWIFLPLFPPNIPLLYKGRKIIDDVTIHSLAASETGDALFSIESPSGRFGMWRESEERSFLPYGPEGSLTRPVELSSLDSPCWHFITVAAYVRRDDPSDPNSRVITLARLYIDGKFSGRLDREGPIKDVESIGNTKDGREGFGKFSSLTILPTCLNAKQIESRYKERRIMAEKRLRTIQASRKDGEVENLLATAVTLSPPKTKAKGNMPFISIPIPHDSPYDEFDNIRDPVDEYAVTLDSPLEDTRPPSLEEDPSRMMYEV